MKRRCKCCWGLRSRAALLHHSHPAPPSWVSLARSQLFLEGCHTVLPCPRAPVPFTQHSMARCRREAGLQKPTGGLLMSKFSSLRSLQSFVCILHLHRLCRWLLGFRRWLLTFWAWLGLTAGHCKPKLVIQLRSLEPFFPSQAENSWILLCAHSLVDICESLT